MSPAARLRRVQRFLRTLAATLFLGAIAELLLIGHAEDATQVIPFAVAGVALAALAYHRLDPGPTARRLLRASLALSVLASLAGVGFHLVANYGIALETRPEAAGLDLLVATVAGGVPLLAPGILAVAAILGFLGIASEADDLPPT